MALAGDHWGQAAALAALLGGVGGCGDGMAQLRTWIGLDDSPQPGPGSDTAGLESQLAFDLLPGFEVSLDGTSVGRTPLTGLHVEPGEHRVVVRRLCASTEVGIAVAGGEHRTLTMADLPGLQTATLRLKISALHGETLAPKAKTGLADDGASEGDTEHRIDGEGKVEVVACRQRVIVHSGVDGIGGYWEDMDVAAGEVVTRELVLAPGPDVVHMPGGEFVVGMRDVDLREIEEFRQTPNLDEDESSLDPVPQRRVVLQPFEIDRHPVTAEQWHACWVAGDCGKLAWHGFLSPPRESDCTTEVGPKRTLKQGREDVPMNCISRWEAEAYCKWVGKRLPTPDEWEYVARSQRVEWRCPWSADGDGDYCDKSMSLQSRVAAARCSQPRRTEQGLCDFGRFNELVFDDRSNYACNDTHQPAPEKRGPIRGIEWAGWETPVCEHVRARLVNVTFRCVRGPTIVVPPSPPSVPAP